MLMHYVNSIQGVHVLPVLWLVVLPGASLTVPARSSLDVEGAVYLVLLCAINGGKVLSA